MAINLRRYLMMLALPGLAIVSLVIWEGLTSGLDHPENAAPNRELFMKVFDTSEIATEMALVINVSQSNRTLH